MAEPSAGTSTFEISQEAYVTVRQTLIECKNSAIRIKNLVDFEAAVFANLAERLQDNMDPVNQKYLGFVVSMLSAMRDNYEVREIALISDEADILQSTRASYLRNKQHMLNFVERSFERC